MRRSLPHFRDTQNIAHYSMYLIIIDTIGSTNFNSHPSVSDSQAQYVEDKHSKHHLMCNIHTVNVHGYNLYPA